MMGTLVKDAFQLQKSGFKKEVINLFQQVVGEWIDDPGETVLVSDIAKSME